MDKQNIINDILQMSESNPALAAQQQHRGIAAGMGPSSKSHMYLMRKVIKLVFHFSRLEFIPRKYSLPKTKGPWMLLFFTFTPLSFLYLQTLGMYDQASQAGVCL